jgi:hypothetical protein
MKVQIRPVNSYYNLTLAEAAELKLIAAQPSRVRQEWLRGYAKLHGTEALAHLFAEFIGLANSVESNARDFLYVSAIVDGNVHPHHVEQLNMPTILGALAGVAVAIEPVKGMCGSCAYRLGTSPNQSECTTQDATDAPDNPWRFMCHHDLDEDGEPLAVCAGFEHVSKLRGVADGHRH